MGHGVLSTCAALALVASPPIAAGIQPTPDDLGVDARVALVDGRPVVDGVYVNGHGPFRFLLDTGSTLNHLDPSLAESIGLKATLTTTLLSSTGSSPVQGCEGVEIHVGTAQGTAQVVLLAGMESVHHISRDIQGVLGQAFLSRFDYELNFRTGRLSFGLRDPDLLEAKTSFTLVAGRPVLSTSLGPMVLDSGTPRVVRFGVAGAPTTLGLLTATGLASVGTVSSTLVINGHAVWRGNALTLAQRTESGADGLLPIEPFRRVFVSNSEKFVVLEPH